jgi:fumarylacetoacetase
MSEPAPTHSSTPGDAYVNETHDPKMKSWVESANDPASDFPIQNLPLCAFVRDHDGHSHRHLGVAIGDQILDVTMLTESGFFDDSEMARGYKHAAQTGYASVFGQSLELRAELRRRLQRFLVADGTGGQQMRRLRTKSLLAQAETRLLYPVPILNYTDFYASKHHATNVGSMFRPDNPLLPNYTHVPIGYHGRASSICLSGSEVRRPCGQTKADDAAAPVYGPCKMLDYEMELGVFVGVGNQLGTPIPIERAMEHAFGMCIVNDWSARDLQKWEYQPLGPFLAKNFATTISPFLVTMEALAPFRVGGPSRREGDPQPLEYLRSRGDCGLDISVEVLLSSGQMREKGMAPVRVSRGTFRDMYWTIDQLIAHHASNGCNLMTGDLLASGTISGASKESRGCLLEMTWDGNDAATGKAKPRVPLQLPTGETRTFLADGDEVIMRASCEREGMRRIGFGECRGVVTPAVVGSK